VNANMNPDTGLPESFAALCRGHWHDPFQILGAHREHQRDLIRALLPGAMRAWVSGAGEMRRLGQSDLFELELNKKQWAALPKHYEVEWTEADHDQRYQLISPYSFKPQIGDLDLHLFGEGRHHHAYRMLGAHLTTVDGIEGCRFAVWAPGVMRVSVVGDFNNWNGLRHPMRIRGSSGVWELFIPGLHANDFYKFEILGVNHEIRLKTDPYARRMALRPDTASRITAQSTFEWQDSAWLTAQKIRDWQHEPMSIYEVHPGSWMRHDDGQFLNYREQADQLVDYVSNLGFTHIELLPIMEHPLDESWGYQVSGYFAPTSRFGAPDDLRYLIDRCHQQQIGVLLDWVPGHFPRDDFALARFTGEACYEHADPRKGEHKDWGTLIFNYGRNEVRNFLLTNAVYWIEEFHLDGLRVDAVASMLYLDYSREEGEWIPNEYGGRENLQAIEFLQHLNEVVHQNYPGVLTMAEESTAWPMVSRPVYMGGLGFSMKWNMGWMNDSLAYFENDPVHRTHHHDKLTFSQLYAYSENFILPLSHDEVVHGKRSLLDKMPGDIWQKFANLRLLLSWQYCHPGKKLLFMGSELGQWQEWSDSQSLDWSLLHYDSHRGVKTLVQDLNELYRQHSSLYRYEFDYQGFSWIDCHDNDQSVLSFMRHDGEQEVICLFNFTPVPRNDYRIGLPHAGIYREILNSDALIYGGSNCGNGGYIQSQEQPWMNFDVSAEITLPPLGAVILQYQKNA